MSGLGRHAGRAVSGDAHLAQSIAVILTTPIGSRVMRRDFGSDLPRLIDQPVTPETVVDLYQATAEALDKWEPRLSLRRVSLLDAAAGKVSIELEMELADGTETLTIDLGAAA